MTYIWGIERQFNAKIHHWTDHYAVNSFKRDDSIKDASQDEESPKRATVKPPQGIC